MQSNSFESVEDGLDIREYLSLLWHWAWLIVLVALVAGAGAFMYSSRLTPYYKAATTIMINEAPATQTTDLTSLALSERLASTYAELMLKQPVLEDVINKLGLNVSSGELKQMITVSAVKNTQLLLISVESTDPVLSAAIANTLVQEFSVQIQEIQSARFSQSKETLEAQLADIESQVTYYAEQSASVTDPAEKEAVDSKLAQYREIYAGLLQSYEQVRLSEAEVVSSIVQVEEATVPTVPVRPDILKTTLMAAMIGLVLSAGCVIAREVLDDTIKTPEEVVRLLDLPVLGVINHYSVPEGELITNLHPRSPTTEAFRTLRTNVTFASLDRPVNTLLITSSEPGEGKTSVISNLAVVMAQTGRQVALLDCDLRHPTVHKRFGLQNTDGITHLFQSEQHLNGSCQKTKIENLSILTTGPLPPNPAELLGSRRMETILGMVRENADFVLIDTPPTLAVTDATVLAPIVDGVILVVYPGKTHASSARHMVEQLRRVNARVLGVVLNNLNMRSGRYGYHYHYYRSYSAYQDYYGSSGKKRSRSKVTSEVE
ncbi:MAG TPA: polysaccharide biosynthesis tyrosine autokinase [Anaerolineaceae bacterium]|nr:polysaccharide biosynthesis tyrosine autokinase [Anaerolineaceae bacterium]